MENSSRCRCCGAMGVHILYNIGDDVLILKEEGEEHFELRITDGDWNTLAVYIEKLEIYNFIHSLHDALNSYGIDMAAILKAPEELAKNPNQPNIKG